MSGVEGQECLILWANMGGFSGIAHFWMLCLKRLLEKWSDPAEDGPEEARMEGGSEENFKQLLWVHITNIRTSGERSLVTRLSKNPLCFPHGRKRVSTGMCCMNRVWGPDDRLARKMFLPSYHWSLEWMLWCPTETLFRKERLIPPTFWCAASRWPSLSAFFGDYFSWRKLPCPRSQEV